METPQDVVRVWVRETSASSAGATAISAIDAIAIEKPVSSPNAMIVQRETYPDTKDHPEGQQNW